MFIINNCALLLIDFDGFKGKKFSRLIENIHRAQSNKLIVKCEPPGKLFGVFLTLNDTTYLDIDFEQISYARPFSAELDWTAEELKDELIREIRFVVETSK